MIYSYMAIIILIPFLWMLLSEVIGMAWTVLGLGIEYLIKLLN